MDGGSDADQSELETCISVRMEYKRWNAIYFYKYRNRSEWVGTNARPSDRPSVRRTVRPTVVYALVVWIVDYVRELLAIRAQALEQLRRN